LSRAYTLHIGNKDYPDDDLKASLVDGRWKFVHRDGSPY
jgi:hypothetical protein